MIYLDNAATTWPKPPCVLKAMTKALEEFGANPGRSGHQMSMDTAEAIYECRREAASFFGAPSPDDVAFTINCTHAVNLALKGILKPGDHVVTSNLEHNAMMRPLEALRRKGISYTAAKVEPGDDDQTIRNFEEAIRPNTKMIACMHASNVFGVRLPIERLGELAKKRGLFFLVDAAQTAGILPIHMQEMGIDFLGIPGHKGLYGPMGTGMLVTDCGEKLDTLLEGGTGSRSVELTQPLYMPDRLESGTVNTPGIVALHAGIQFVEQQGMDGILQHETQLMQRFYDAMCDQEGVQFYTPRPDGIHILPVVSFNLGDLPSTEAARYYDEAEVALRPGLHCAPCAHRAFGTLEQGTMRLCPSIFTTQDEVDEVINSTLKIINKL